MEGEYGGGKAVVRNIEKRMELKTSKQNKNNNNKNLTELFVLNRFSHLCEVGQLEQGF